MPMMDDPNERLDLVDGNDQKTDTVSREAILTLLDGKAGYVRAANGFVVNDAGEVWVPHRAPHKKIAPNGLDYSAGEHVGAGESYVEAVVRGFREELNMVISPEDVEYIGKLAPRPNLPYFESLFVYRANGAPSYNTDDFTAYEWLLPQDFLSRLAAGAPAKDGLKEAVEILIAYNNKEQKGEK